MQKTLIETRDCGHPCALAAISRLPSGDDSLVKRDIEAPHGYLRRHINVWQMQVPLLVLGLRYLRGMPLAMTTLVSQ